MSRLAKHLATAVLACTLPACEAGSSCTPTTTAASRADKVNVGVASRSAVIEARLTTASGPLSGRRLTFDVLDDGATVYTAEARTGSSGTARVDLKRADAGALLAIVRGDEFRATFDGDSTYCGSDDGAPFHAVRA